MCAFASSLADMWLIYLDIHQQYHKQKLAKVGPKLGQSWANFGFESSNDLTCRLGSTQFVYSTSWTELRAVAIGHKQKQEEVGI